MSYPKRFKLTIESKAEMAAFVKALSLARVKGPDVLSQVFFSLQEREEARQFIARNHRIIADTYVGEVND